MIRSGITPIDTQSGGFVRGRIHLLTGGPGTGKTTASLQFLKEGLKQGDRVAILTAERLDDLADFFEMGASWFDKMSRIPSKRLQRAMKLGEKVFGLLGIGD